jgi:hypothetical protein
VPRRPSPGPHQTELISVRLEPQVARRVRDAARLEGITASASIRRLILRDQRRPADDRRWGSAPRRPRSRQPRRSPHDHALRPGPSLPRPPRHLHRGHVPRRRQPLTPIGPALAREIAPERAFGAT